MGRCSSSRKGIRRSTIEFLNCSLKPNRCAVPCPYQPNPNNLAAIGTVACEPKSSMRESSNEHSRL